MRPEKILGILGELRATDYLKKNGFRILEKNFRCRFGEIDIIAEKNSSIHFVEVKTRKNFTYGEPAESIDRKKLLKIKNCASYYLNRYNYFDTQIYFDAIIIIIQDNKTSIDFIDNID